MKVILPIIAVVVAAGLGIYTFSQRSSSETATEIRTTNNNGSSANTSNGSENLDSSSRYIEYSKSNLERSSNTRRVLYFYANWCPTCRPADIDFQQNAGKIPEDVTLIRVNYNDSDTDQEEKELATKYGITYQHTFVQIDSSGNVVTKWNGGQIEELLKNIK